MTEASTTATRAVDLTIEIDASPDDVWKAITDADELIRWFPPIASVEPGEGGHVMVSWGGGSEWKSSIVTWEPGRHLRLEDELPEGAEEGAVGVALDYFLEGEGGTTVVRLVNSGFSAADDWDDFYHMLENGWTFFLWNLKHYLERHPGTPRTMISVRQWVTGSREEVWDGLFGANGLGPAPREGDPFRFDLGDVVLSGTAVLSDRPWGFAAKVDSLNDGILHVELEGSGERWKLGVWLSAYGVDESRTDAARKALESRLGALEFVVHEDAS